MNSTDDALAEQLDYYRARAPEYDEWWLRQGRYDRGPEQKAAWVAETREVAATLAEFRPRGRVLELACGTGIWTEQLLPFAEELTAVDGSGETLAINATRLRSPKIRYVEADLFRWQPREKFDTVFFSFWLSHVPPERFDDFWSMVGGCLAPGGRVFFVDSLREPGSIAVNHALPVEPGTTLQRKLNDGREFTIYKVFYAPDELACALARIGWRAEVRQTPRFFLHGAASRRSPAHFSP